MNGNGAVWDLTSYFPEFAGPAMHDFQRSLAEDIQTLIDDCLRLKTLSRANVERWETLILKAENVYSRLGHLASYLECLEAADAYTEAYSLESAALANRHAEFEKIETDMMQAFKRSRQAVFQALLKRSALQDISYYLHRLRQRGRHSMSRSEETLALELNVDGLQAWGRLYDKISAKLEFEMPTAEGTVERRPISQWRTLMSQADRTIGRQAFEGGNRAWARIEDVCAAALNAIAGARLSLNRRRKVSHFLDRPLFQAGLRRETLDAMYQAVYEHIDVARDILRTKADFFGRAGIWFFEREAPLPLASSESFSWPEATATVHRAFSHTYPRLADYFQEMLRKRWVESEPRPGKRPGAFCSGSSWIGEQRVFMTFNGSLGNVTTLAHEVGHAWHSHLLRKVRPFARRYPMTLAETASIFAEHLLVQGLAADPQITDSQKFALLDAELTDAAVFLLDITTRFEFEKAFYERRCDGEVPVSTLKALMTETQESVYGDSLLPGGADPLFWASKLHFYITDISFYNFPYTFGYLLARGLLQRYLAEGNEFLTTFERLLQLSGSDTVENIGIRALEVNFPDPAFWQAALQTLEKPLATYRQAMQPYRIR